MFGTQNIAGKCALAGGLALALAGPHGASASPQYTLLYTFTGGNDGSSPAANLIKDKLGNLYGTTALGGNGGHGTVFELAPDGTLSVLHTFAGGANGDGSNSRSGLTRTAGGDYLGTTQLGGTSKVGSVFELSPDGTESLVHSFTGGSDGASPQVGLTKVGHNYFGTTLQGGSGGSGTVFELSNKKGVWVESIVYAFTGGNDGGAPYGGLVADAAGNLYGTTSAGGTGANGTVYKIAPDGTETVLYAFTGGSDGCEPSSTPILDSSGNLYATAYYCGDGGNPSGTAFKLAPDGTLTVLHSFTGYGGGTDGALPYYGLTFDKKGNLYGATNEGGTDNCGIDFKIAPDGTYTILYNFTCGSDGATPAGPLLFSHGKLYGGTVNQGADGAGVLYSLTTK